MQLKALVSYFDVVFGSMQTTIVLPTGPSTTPTHWAQVYIICINYEIVFSTAVVFKVVFDVF